jgi:hypothetical protein
MIRKLIKNKGSACGSCEKCAKTGSCGLPQFVKYIDDVEGGEKDEQ